MFSPGTASRVCLYQPYNQCRLVLRAWHPPRSRRGYIVSISTGPTRRQLRDSAAARSIVIVGVKKRDLYLRAALPYWSACVEGFGCRPIAAMRLAPWPASESLQLRNTREMGRGGGRRARGAGRWGDTG